MNCSHRCPVPTYGGKCQLLCENCSIDVCHHVHGCPHSEIGKYNVNFYVNIKFSFTLFFIFLVRILSISFQIPNHFLFHLTKN